jgi:hypothetical protein
MNQSNPISWAYPFPGKDSSNNPLQLLTHMAQAKGGFYPTGENGLWHGGVHFDEGTAAAFDQSSVRCIADGEVIAYRIDERYPVSEFTDDIRLVQRAPFSTGFVLVKHSLQPPPLKNADGSIAEGQTPPSLTLYSLYMHLLDWAGYQAQPDLPRPTFWETKRYTVNTQQDGLSVRSGPSKNTTKLSELSKGAEITIGRAEGEFSKLVSLISGTAQPALSADDEGQLPGYVSSDWLKPHSEPAECGKVVVLDSGVSIKAGELIGHPGLYQNHDSAAQHMVHVELFSCDDVPAFIAQSRAWASRLPDDQKTLLKVYKGASKLIPHRVNINTENPPKLDDDGTLIGVDLIIPQSLLDGLPASRKIQVKDAADNTMHWWQLDGLFADANGNPIEGWLAEQEPITTRHSPWEWEGFQCIEETGTPVEKLAYAFNARGLLSADEQHNYRAQISKADGGPIVTLARLYDIVDTNSDGVLTSAEIQAALARPWHAQVLAQLVAKYESEWFWNKGKWDELDLLLAEEPGKPNLVWEVEKQRIERLCWWSELVGQHGISEDREAWHIQIIGLIANFNLIDDKNDLKWLKVPRGQLTFDAEGNDIEGSHFFSRVPHWPPVGASGVTIGRGYDVGHQPNVRDDLEGVGISEPLLSWLSGGKGLTKNMARDYLNSASAGIRSTPITRKQQHDLFVFVYEFMEKDVRRICEKRDVIEAYGATDWDALHPKIKNMLVDLRYRGDYTPNIRSLLQEYVANNDLARFSSVIKNRSNWPQTLPSDRFLRRSRYIDE